MLTRKSLLTVISTDIIAYAFLDCYWVTETVSIILDVTVDLSLYFTEEEYYSQYKDNSQARMKLQEKIKDNVSV